MMKRLAIIAVILIAAFSIVSVQTCDPEADCAAAAAGTLVQDPADCHNYYVCVNINGDIVPSSVPLKCPVGEYFDPVTEMCATETVPCTNNCTSGSCNSTCSETYEIIGVPGDCTKYLICLLGGDTVEVQCPPGTPYFDGTECTDNEALCCDFCSPVCDAAGVQVPDPLNCTNFYICLEVGTPDESVHAHCPTGEIFDPNLGDCVAGSTCTPICSATASTTLSTSSSTTTAPTTTLSTSSSTTTAPSTTLSTSSSTTTAPPTTLSTSSSTTTTPTTLSSSSSTTTSITTSATSTTTTSISTTTIIPTTVVTTTTSSCLDSYTCTVDGNFPRCQDCDPSYFTCSGGTAEINYCSGNTVFNPNPNYPFCVLPENCPYP